MNRTKHTMNRTKHFSNRLLISFFALVLSGVIVAQEGTRTTIDMMQGGHCTIDGIFLGFNYEFNQEGEKIWGWYPEGPQDFSDLPPVNGVQPVDNRFALLPTQYDPSPRDNLMDISAIYFEKGRTRSVRQATEYYYPNEVDYYGNITVNQTAAASKIWYQFLVSQDNAIVYFDYAVMLEHPENPNNPYSHYVTYAGTAWKYFQPWVQMYVIANNDTVAKLIHAIYAPTGLEGWQECSKANGWRDANVDKRDNPSFQRHLYLYIKDWNTAGLDLRQYIGQTVQIVCEHHDCAVYDFDINGSYSDPIFCADHHMARLYSSLNCTQPLLQKESETCEPASAVTYSAPEGFAYRWYTAANPGVTISTDRVCTYQFGYRGEQTTLFCELQSPSSMSPTTLNVDIADKCVIECTYEFPTYVCADASTIDVTFNYTSGYPKSYDITFDDNALVNGFVSQTNQTILQGSTMISVPMPPSNNTQYARPNIYYYTLRVHQSNGTDTVFSKALEVRYPSKIISQRWNDVLALLNQNYNGGYMFSSIEWFQDGAPAWSNAPYKTYLYQPGGLKAESEYWAQLTRTLDGLTFCTCPFRPVIQPENTPAPERIQLTADNTNSRVVHVNTNMSGVYTLYNIDGKIIRQGYFGTEYGSPTIQLPAAGTYIIRFDDNEQGSETKKWLAK